MTDPTNDTLDPAASVDALLERAITALTATSGTGGPVTGRSASGQVTAYLRADGIVESLDIDPRTLRGSAEQIAADIMAAVNDAVDARPAVSSGGRSQELRAVQEQSLTQSTAMRAVLETRLARIVADATES